MADLSKCIAVAAIDFGTTYSGWALSFRHNYEMNPLKVETRHWNSGEHISLKTSTTVLIQPDGITLEAFGYKAEDRFQKIVEVDPANHKGYYYFRRFKMVLFQNNNINRQTELIAGNGTRLPALKVFGLAIKWLKDDALEECGQRFSGGLSVEDIHWTLTVPAIWKEKAKNFMREAADRAGIPSPNLTIVLEPEAASIYCMNQPLRKDHEGVESFQPGTKYLVLDCGGGTIDISCHEVVGKSQIKEIHKFKGNAFGGTCVDNRFAKLLKEMFGEKVWDRFKSERMSNYTTFFRHFETKKREIDSRDELNVTLPFDLYELYQEENGVDFRKNVPKTPWGKHVSLKPGTKVQFKAEFISKLLFEESIASITKCVKGILKTPGLEDVKHVLLVGGYGESRVLQKRLQEEFPSLTFIVPQEPGIAVLVGAVIFGHDTSVVKERLAQFTYGTRIAIDYDPKVHTEDKIVDYDGEKMVLSFRLLVKSNQSIGNDYELDVGNYIPVTDDQKTIEFPIYAVDMDREADADDDDDDYIPVYASDQRCTELGKVVAKITNRDVPKEKRNFNLKLMFGRTEIEAVLKNKITMEETKAKIDFIGKRPVTRQDN